MKAIRIHQFGGPEVLQYRRRSRPEPEAGRSARQGRRGGGQLHRHVSAHRRIQDPAADHSRTGRRRHRDGRWSRRDQRQGRRQGGVDRHPRELHGIARDPGRSARRAAGWRDDKARRGDDAPGHDGALPRDVHVSAQGRRYVPRARGRRRRRAAAHANREAARRARHHDGVDRREGEALTRGGRRRRGALHDAGLRGRGQEDHRREKSSGRLRFSRAKRHSTRA